MQSSIIFRYVAVLKRTKFVYSEKTQLQEVLFWESSKFRFPKRLWERHRSSRNRSLEWRSRFFKITWWNEAKLHKTNAAGSTMQTKAPEKRNEYARLAGKTKSGTFWENSSKLIGWQNYWRSHDTFFTRRQLCWERTSVTCCPDIGTNSLTVRTAYDKVNSAVDCITVKFLKLGHYLLNTVGPVNKEWTSPFELLYVGGF